MTENPDESLRRSAPQGGAALSPTPAAATEDIGSLAAIDRVIWSGAETARNQAEQMIRELRSQLRARDQWLLVEDLARFFEARPWLLAFDVMWDPDEDTARVAEWRGDGVAVNKDALDKFLSEQAETPAAKAIRDEAAGLGIEEAAGASMWSARRLATQELEGLNWPALGNGFWEKGDQRVARGTRESIAALLLSHRSLAQWEAAGLRRELAGAPAAAHGDEPSRASPMRL